MTVSFSTYKATSSIPPYNSFFKQLIWNCLLLFFGLWHATILGNILPPLRLDDRRNWGPPPKVIGSGNAHSVDTIIEVSQAVLSSTPGEWKKPHRCLEKMEEAGWRYCKGWLSTKTNTYTVTLCSFKWFFAIPEASTAKFDIFVAIRTRITPNGPDPLIRTKIGPNYAGSDCPDKILKLLLSWVKIRTRTMK